MKPNLKNLVFYETYEKRQKNISNKGNIFSKTIGIIPTMTELPFEYDRKVKMIFNSTETATHLVRDI